MAMVSISRVFGSIPSRASTNAQQAFDRFIVKAVKIGGSALDCFRFQQGQRPGSALVAAGGHAFTPFMPSSV